MKIKTHLTINFTLLVACILTIFSICIYLFYLEYRQQDFKIRLQNKAKNTAALLFGVKSIDAKFLKIIDSSTITNMNDVSVIAMDKSHKLLYSSRDSLKVRELLPFFFKLNWKDNSSKFFSGKLYLCIKHIRKDKEYYVFASAIDLYGQQELKKLLAIIVIVFVFSLFLIIFAGYINSTESLRPIKDVIKQVDDFKASNLSKRLDLVSNDEIAELAGTFNKMLDRIEKAFETERTFVANASHELRTPVTSVKGQLEVALIKPRTEEEYRTLLNSILDDIQNMTNIINGFLELAETNIEPGSIHFDNLRIDEILFAAKEEMGRRKAAYYINIVFDNIPADENEITVFGNARLLKILMINLIDNACKFSDNKRATVRIAFDEQKVIVKVIDNGIGIPKEELENVFQPLYRAKNVTGKTGNGIGMSIVKKITELHGGYVNIESEVNVGTTVTISFMNTKVYN